MITVLLLSSSNSIVVTRWCFTFTKQAPRKALGGGGSSGAASRAIASAAGGAGAGKNITINLEILQKLWWESPTPKLSLTCVWSSCREKGSRHSTRNIMSNSWGLAGSPAGKYSGGNSYNPQPTPDWQKKMTSFLIKSGRTLCFLTTLLTWILVLSSFVQTLTRRAPL